MAVLKTGNRSSFADGVAAGQCPVCEGAIKWQVRGVLGGEVGAYYNVSHAGSPIASADFSQVVRAYSFVAGARGVSVYVGEGSGAITYQDGWRVIGTAYALQGADGR